ncbi:thioredoxin-like protein [Umbelopsis sp. AD052]|nr:thioredoxin-like protein [Umbelopsis sp. AD052]
MSDEQLLQRLQNQALEDRQEPERRDSIESQDSDAEDDRYSHEAPAHQPIRTEGRKTGPKGVLADYAFHKQLKSEADQARLRAYHKRMVNQAITTTSYGQDQQELVLEHINSDEDEIDNEDEDAIQAYRQQRLKEFARISNPAVRRQQKVFGQVDDIDANEFSTIIDNEWKSVPIVIHLYDESIPHCRQVDDIFADLARKYAMARFVRVSAHDLEFDLVESSAILGYRGGLLVANLVRLVDYVNSRFEVETVEDVLLKYNAVTEDDIYDAPPAAARQNASDDEDDDI